ncbi:hypothetical protein PPS11_26971 [Pseudomonas putida S11]|nr:hypothetical protein PPS11_26971 [Pseudomonas putida S11]
MQPGPGNVPVTVSGEALSFSAKALAGAGDQPHLIASNVKLSQSIQLSHDPLRVGDSITRTLSLQAGRGPGHVDASAGIRRGRRLEALRAATAGQAAGRWSGWHCRWRAGGTA